MQSVKVKKQQIVKIKMRCWWHKSLLSLLY